jgi:D-alanyl-D-alanine carboxypeptidase (penicillin-binding protein 5/6)
MPHQPAGDLGQAALGVPLKIALRPMVFSISVSHMKWLRPLSILLFTVLAAACSTTSSPPPQAAAVAPPPIAASPAGAPEFWPANAPEILAQSAILIDARSGKVLFQKNADTKRPVASTQKLLTALIVTRAGNLEESVTIAAPETRAEPTKLGLKVGEQYPRRKLLEAILVKSSNDACAALARDHSGSEAAFAEKMNATAVALGANSSHFANSNGLPADQYSTARDIARIAFHAYRNPALREMMLKKKSYFRHNSGRVSVLEATNFLLDRSPAFNGMKTGYTNAAGRCLVSSGTMNGREVILVQLGSKTKHIFNDAAHAMAWAPPAPAFFTDSRAIVGDSVF